VSGLLGKRPIFHFIQTRLDRFFFFLFPPFAGPFRAIMITHMEGSG